ncbi:Apoptosis regulator Bcl-2 [Bagarius yarrelli]|uniref:Apoptosis regulator Bcl-2 n=1 Tax=Bagarius yarrelli TaxID=175774 RepID=A0A556TZV6_BAGYA|nr:Apoptosis regulator Bcl-2 [Bagarius yarrelli]
MHVNMYTGSVCTETFLKPNMANANLYDNQCIVEKYLNHKLSKNGHTQEILLSRTRSPDDQEGRQEESASRANLQRALREAGDELESLYRTDLTQLSKRLRGAPVGAEQRRFAAVTDELFRDGVNWGRVVAFFEFGAMVCVQCPPDAERSACAENVARWMTEYLNGPLNGWIQENGGWVRNLHSALDSSLCTSRLNRPLIWVVSANRFCQTNQQKRTESLTNRFTFCTQNKITFLHTQ